MAPLVISSLFFSACGVSRGTPSTLQRYDRLQPQVKATTNASRRLSADFALLARVLRMGKPQGVRAASVRVKKDSRALVRGTGELGYALRRLMHPRLSSTTTRYIHLNTEVLSSSWYEGKALIRLSNLTWGDPWIATHPDERLLLQLSRAAQRAAMRSVTAGLQAAEWRHRFIRKLRYHPV